MVLYKLKISDSNTYLARQMDLHTALILMGAIYEHEDAMGGIGMDGEDISLTLEVEDYQ